jgi:hypothetical protein
MQLAGASVLPGAKSRLLPASIPFSCFGAAIVFHVALWGLALRSADGIAGFRGGLGHALGTLHVLTLGVLGCTAMGAGFQLLQVATRRPLRALWPARAAFWLLVPGVILLVHGMGEGSAIALEAGGGLAAAGLLLFAGLVADNLRRSPDLGVVVLHARVSIAALLLLVAAGLLLVADFGTGWIGDHGALALAHGILGLYGFMGTLTLGFSYILLPMFALAAAVPVRWGQASLALWVLALIVAIVGALAAAVDVLAIGAATGGIAVLIHVVGIGRVLAKRMRRRLGLSFVLIRAAWGFLLASLVLGALAALGLLGERGPAFFGFVAMFGWLLTFLLGVLQRILPFLASMHAAKGSRPPLVSQLVSERALGIHAVCHFTALAAVVLGIALDRVPLILSGAAIGFTGSLAFAWFGAVVIYRVVRPARPLSSAPAVAVER